MMQQKTFEQTHKSGMMSVSDDPCKTQSQDVRRIKVVQDYDPYLQTETMGICTFQKQHQLNKIDFNLQSEQNRTQSLVSQGQESGTHQQLAPYAVVLSDATSDQVHRAGQLCQDHLS